MIKDQIVENHFRQSVKMVNTKEEDRVWNSIASERDTEDVKFISHKKAWDTKK